MAAFMGPGRYVNYLGEDEQGEVPAAYGPNYRRLAQIKAKYDPDNFFRMNQNIRPARLAGLPRKLNVSQRECAAGC